MRLTPSQIPQIKTPAGGPANHPAPFSSESNGARTPAEVPTSALQEMSARYEPVSIARTITASQLHGILQQAEAGDARDLFALYRDVILSSSHLLGEVFKRKLAVLGDSLSFVPLDKSRPAAEAANQVRLAITNCKGWRLACSHLLDGFLWPVAVVEKVYAVDQKGYRIDRLVKVPHHLLDFRSGRLMILDVSPEGQPLFAAHEADPMRYIVHRGHLLTTPDNWGGPMRSILFWWLLATMDRGWWVRFLDRFGTPFPVGKFRDDEGRTVLERAFSLAVRLGGLVVSNSTEVELLQAAATDSGTAFKMFLEVCHAEMSKLVIGQTLSSSPSPTGEIGGGTAKLQSGVREDIRQFDAKMLSETLRDQLIVPYCKINGIADLAPTMVWGSESAEEQRQKIGLVEALGKAGLEPADDAIPIVSEQVGFPLRRKSPLPQGIAPTTFAAGLHPFAVRQRAILSRP